MRKVQQEVTGGSFKLVSRFQLVHPLVLQNVLGLFLNSPWRSSTSGIAVVMEGILADYVLVFLGNLANYEIMHHTNHIKSRVI